MIHYGRDEIIAFAKGMAAHTRVDIRVRNGQPRTDGKTVWIDCSPCATQTEYLIRTGDADHEIAHVWFDSVARLKGHAAHIAQRSGKPGLEWAAHECLNVVLDIHDETRLANLIPGVEEALRQGNLQAGAALWKACQTGNDEPRWRTQLLIGILASRLGRKRASGSWIGEFHYRHVNRLVNNYLSTRWGGTGAAEILTICNSCRERPSKNKSVDRSASEWAKIVERGKRLFELILPSIRPEHQLPQPTDGQGNPLPGTDQQRNDAGKRLREAALANETTGHTTSQPFEDQGPRQAKPNGQPGSGAGYAGNNGQKYAGANASFYSQCMVTMGKAIDVMMETQESMRLNHYRDQGEKLGKHWPSIFTSGKAFVAKDKGEGRELNLALLLDRSSSMDRIIDDCAAACAAIGMNAQSNGATVETWLFGDTTSRVPCHTLSRGVDTEGGTAGADAMKQATHWLMGQSSGRRLCVVVTDGCWSDRSEAAGHLLAGARHNVEYVFIGLGMSKPALTNGWPTGLRAIACEANAHRLAEQLIAVAGPGTV